MKKIIAVSLLFQTTSHAAQTVECPVTEKFDFENGRYSAAHLSKSRFSVKIIERNEATTVSRCSFSPSAGKITCDDYVVDHIEIDKHLGIKKYYYFKGQFDVQVFPSRSMIENNGRGGFSFGKCEIK